MPVRNPDRNKELPLILTPTIMQCPLKQDAKPQEEALYNRFCKFKQIVD